MYNLPVELPEHVIQCLILLLPVISKHIHILYSCGHHASMMPTAVQYVYVLGFGLSNKLREVDVWLVSSHSLPAWSCWLIVCPFVCVCLCVCFHTIERYIGNFVGNPLRAQHLDYSWKTVVGVWFSKNSCTIVVGVIDTLSSFSLDLHKLYM